MDASREGLERIGALINEQCGIFLGDAKKTFLEANLAPRLVRTNSENFKDYYLFLKYDPHGEQELNDLIDAITVNETFFFRHPEQLGDFCNEAVPEILRRKKHEGPLVVWSAGCSTGEEAYTLAVLLLESPFLRGPSSIRIVASDISASALRSAGEGVYDDHSLRHAPHSWREKYFDKNPSGNYVIHDRVKRLVTFCAINLTDSRATARMRDVDCIFCRNVIIYFDDAHKSRCVENLYQSMTGGGYLFLGYSETLGRISNLFRPVKLKTTVAYRKPG
jgi:chemotaxis protein methyltransferase CheR